MSKMPYGTTIFYIAAMLNEKANLAHRLSGHKLQDFQLLIQNAVQQSGTVVNALDETAKDTVLSRKFIGKAWTQWMREGTISQEWLRDELLCKTAGTFEIVQDKLGKMSLKLFCGHGTVQLDFENTDKFYGKVAQQTAHAAVEMVETMKQKV